MLDEFKIEEKKEKEITFLPPLNNNDTYYFISAEWVTIDRPKLVTELGQDQQKGSIQKHKDNFLINIPPVTFWLMNKLKYQHFIITNSMVITKKMFEAAAGFMEQFQKKEIKEEIQQEKLDDL